MIAASSAYSAGPSISITPANPSIRAGQVQDFDVSVQGLPNSFVSWAVNGVAGGNATLGTIGSGGLYVAPSNVYAGPITLTATSISNSAVVGSTSITLLNPQPKLYAITPSAINTGAFQLSVRGANMLPGITATLNSTPLTVTYVSSTQITVTGTTNAAPGASVNLSITNPNPGASSASGAYTVAAAVTVSILPGNVTLSPGDQEDFTSIVTNTTNKAVNWLVNGIVGGNSVVGTIDGNGVYQAPAITPTPNTVSVQAQSLQSPTVFSTASTITLLNLTPVISSVSPNPISHGSFTITVTGNSFVPGAQIIYGSTPLATQFRSSTQLVASGTAVPVVGATVPITVSNPGPPTVVSNMIAVALQTANPKMSYASAFHFLEQATWGPTPNDIDHLQKIGFQQWFTEQSGAPLSTFTPNAPSMITTQSDYYFNALTGSDQLRQRVAFALSQIFVVSSVKDPFPTQMVPYLQILESDALGNFSNLMYDITVNPSMGRYLDMANNVKPFNGSLPNENYARELMQLFTTGPVLLNIDGTQQTDGSGNTIPLYTETTIQNFARVFTGWTYPTMPGSSPGAMNPPYYVGPMIISPSLHDTGAKTLLNGVQLPAGQTADVDLQSALNNVFQHPNVGPWVCSLLIQHLVSSNPSPAYVSRIASVFNNDGTGTRGNLQAVIQALLLDPEARQSDAPSTWISTGGHFREPVLFLTTVLRNMNATASGSNLLSNLSNGMGQSLFYPPSVAGYYTPTNPLPVNSSIVGPEYSTLTASSGLARVNWINNMSHGITATTGVTVDLTPFLAVAGDPNSLVQAVSKAFLAGQMPQAMQNSILTALSGVPPSPYNSVGTAIYLTASSGFFQVQH